VEAKECKVLDILTENKKYIIPSYQRPYSWQTEHVEKLLDDIVHSYQSNENEYFIGSVICINKGGNTFEVVDGQQRLTTLSLILLQIKNTLADKGDSVKNRRVCDDLQKRLLPIDVYSEDSSEPRLTVRKKEFNFYTQYILQNQISYKPEKPSDTENRFIENNDLIKNYFSDFSEELLRNLAQYIVHKIYIVFVTTEDISSSFRLFNVLNNRGLSLSNADLLKNTLLEAASKGNNLKKSDQVEASWSEIENLIGVTKLDKFLTINKISEKRNKNRFIDKIFESYNESLIKDYDKDSVKMSMALYNSAKNYIKIIENDFENVKTRRIIGTLLMVNPDEWIPPVLVFLNTINKSTRSRDGELCIFMTAFEKVYMQSWIKKQIKSQREKIIYSALVSINNNLLINEICSSIVNHSDNQGFCDFLDNDVYEPTPNQSNLTKAVLLRIDAEQQDESVIKTYTGRITIEHILPQKPNNSYWHERFDTDQHSQWLHKLGNLTLISGSKNSEAQNSDFFRKKSIYEKSNKKCSFDITKAVCQCQDWTVEVIENRHKMMTKILKDLWLV
jgi:uncharacterized protein with ParB-like and HNH nuclease domain